MQLSMTQPHGFIYNKIPIIIVYNLLTNRWLEYGIIRWWECDDVKNYHILYGWNELGFSVNLI